MKGKDKNKSILQVGLRDLGAPSLVLRPSELGAGCAEQTFTATASNSEKGSSDDEKKGPEGDDETDADEEDTPHPYYPNDPDARDEGKR